MLKIGLKQNKSKTLGKLKIPDRYFFDFLRGCFDGDGSIYSYWDPRWQSSFMFYLKFVSASPDFLFWLQSSIRRLLGLEGKIGNASRSLQLVFAKNDTRIIYRKMFYRNNLPCLQRKLMKIKKILTTDMEHDRMPRWRNRHTR